ncbi:MAG: TRAP transporter substrate-binding protein [Geminicoccaceae bacterium]
MTFGYQGPVRAAFLAAGLALGLGTAASAETLVVAVTDPVGSLKDRMCQRFVDDVTARADASLSLNFVQGEALGAANSVMEQLIGGSVGIFCNELVWFADYVPDIQILGWGFTFRDPDHMAAFFESDLFKPLAERAIEQGARILAAQPTQPRMMFTKEPINSIDDIQGMKMRVPQLKSYLELWKALGTNPTQVAWAEVYLALSTGVVVAAEGPPTDALGQKFHEVAPNITRTDHLFSTVMIAINEDAYQLLSPQMQEVVRVAAQDATKWARGVAEEEVSTMLAQAETEGAKVAQIDKAPFQERSREAVDRMEGEGLWRKGLWADIQKL